MKKFRLALLLPLLAAALQGCVEMAVVGTAGAAAGLSMSEDRRSSGAQLDDQSIEWRSSSRIGDRFGSKVHVNITSYNRAALLTGEVPDERTRGEIDGLVRGVTNDLQVAGGSSLTARASDATITGKVKARLFDSGKLNPIHVKVITEAGVVYLLGTVTEKEADDAVEIDSSTLDADAVVARMAEVVAARSRS